MKKLTFKTYVTIFLVLIFIFYKINNANSKNYSILDNVESKYGNIWIYERKNTRCMSDKKPISNVESTCMYISDVDRLVFNYTKMVMASLFLTNNYDKILVVGLGGGSIINAFSKLLPNSKIDVVEINDVMLPLAQKYFNFKITQNINVIIEDGFNFVKNTKNKYDIIVLDAFTPDYIPPSFLTKEFMINLKKILKDGGVVASNVFVNSKHNERELYNKFFDENILTLTKGGNRIILAANNEFPKLDNIILKADKLNENFKKVGVDTKWLIEILKKENNK